MEPILKNNIVLLGENSRLTEALKKQVRESTIIPKNQYSNWNNSSFLENLISKHEGSTLIITKAILDPGRSRDEVYYWNFLFPKNLITQIIKQKSNTKVVTIGSVHELSNITNNYLISKRELAQYILEKKDFRFKHIRLHTIYGQGLPVPNMFLGQMYDSLKNNKPFKMSHGMQLRQYHDYQTIAKNLKHVIDNWTNTSSSIDFNGKEWIRLKDLALEVFSFFEKEYLLEIGEIESNQNELIDLENFEIGPYNFPEAIPTIIKYLKKILDEKS